MKYKVGDVILYNQNDVTPYNQGDVMLYGHCEYLIVDIDYNWGCPNYIVRMRYDQGSKLSEKRYKIRASLLDESSELLNRGEAHKEENQMNIEHKKKPETKIKTNLEMIREMDSTQLAEFLVSHSYQPESDEVLSELAVENVETWLDSYVIDAESACKILRASRTDKDISERDYVAAGTLALKYIEGAELLKKEVAEISGVSAKAAKMIQDLVAQYLP